MTRAGVVVVASDAVKSAFGLHAYEGDFLLVRAEDARAIRFPTALRWLGRFGSFRVGAALVEGRILSAVQVGGPPDSDRGARREQDGAGPASGLVVQTGERGEGALLVGLTVVAAGSFDRGLSEGTVLYEGRQIPEGNVAELFEELERVTWELRRSNRAPSTEERRST